MLIMAAQQAAIALGPSFASFSRSNQRKGLCRANTKRTLEVTQGLVVITYTVFMRNEELALSALPRRRMKFSAPLAPARPT